MLLLDYIFLAVLFIYIAEMMFFRKGLDWTEKYERNYTYEPTVSIIVAARNEEENIGNCVSSLVQLDYPRDKFEAIVVNDGSTDNTAAVVQEFSQKNPRVKLVNATPGSGNLRGKANALAQGIDRSQGEILFFTDADCVVPSTWIRETVSYYTENVGIVAGFTSLTSRKTFEAVQALDWFYLWGVASAAATWNMPLTAVGNNSSVRRSAYESIGGYRNLPFSVTEDYTLAQAIWQKTRLRIRYPVNSKTLVESKPCASWKELFRQKQRWGVGGLGMVLRGFLFMSVHFAMHLLILLGLLMIVFSLPGKPASFLAGKPSLAIFMGSLAGKMLFDLYFLWKPLRIFKKQSLLKYFPAFELYYSIYELLLPFIALLSKKVVWKERSFGDKEKH